MDINNINRDRDTSGLGPIEYDQSKVPQLSRKYSSDIRSKIYGKDVRESIARGVEYAGLVASESKSLANSADSIAKDTQSRFDRQIHGSTNDNEVIDARGSFDILGHRFTFNELNARPFRNVEAYGVQGNTGNDLQDVINSLEEGYHYIFPKGEYSIRGQTDGVADGMRVKNDTTYEFKHGAELKVMTNSSENYNGILIENAQNFEIINSRVIGDRYEHDYTSGGTHERGAGVMIRGNSKGRIINPYSESTTGDGIDIIAGTGSDIYIENPQTKNVRRNGISVESADKLRIVYGDLDYTSGTNPQAGLDIEPFADYCILNDVRIVGLKTHGSGRRGLMVAGLSYLDSYNIVLDDCVFDGIEFGRTFFSGYNFKGRNIEINRPHINGKFGIRSWDSAPHAVINDPVFKLQSDELIYSAINLKRTNAISNAPFGALKVFRARILNSKSEVQYPISLDVNEALPENRSIGATEIEVVENNIGGIPIIFSDVTNINMPDFKVKVANNKVDYSSGTGELAVLVGQHITNDTATQLTRINLYNEINKRMLGTLITVENTGAPIQINAARLYNVSDESYKIYPFNSQKIRCDIYGGKIKLRYGKIPKTEKPAFFVEEIIGPWKEVTT